MSSFPSDWLYEFVTLLVVLDPIATVPVFLAVTAGLDRRQSARVAMYALGAAFLILVFFIAFGQLLLEALQIPMASFQLAGSLLLLLLGLQMAQATLPEPPADAGSGQGLLARAFFPLATPVIAGGAAILTVVLLTDNRTRSVDEQITTVFVLMACLSVHLVSFLLAGVIRCWLGVQGIQVISRVFGLILTSVAVNGIIVAIKQSFGLAT